MSIVSKAALKNDFADGTIITENKMDDLIDSTYNPNLVAGTDITLVPSGNDITINATGGGGVINLYTTDGTLTGNRELSGAGFDLSLGEGLSKLNTFVVNSSNAIDLNSDFGTITLNSPDIMVLGADTINLSTAGFASGGITLSTYEISFSSLSDTSISFNSEVPSVGDVLTAKDAAGTLEWTTPNVQVAVFTIDEARMQTLDVTPETLVAIPAGKFLIILNAMAIIYVPFINNVNLQIEYAGCNIPSNMMWGTIPGFTNKPDNTGCYFNQLEPVLPEHQFGENCTLELSLSGASGLPSMASSTSVVWVSYMIVDA